MRPAYTIDLENSCIFIKWSGVVGAHDFIAFNRGLVQDSDYRSGLNRLVDVRGLEVEASFDEIDEMARENINKRDASEGHRKVAVLVSSDLGYGLTRMLGSMADQTRTVAKPFRRLDKAAAWLGLPETIGDPFEELCVRPPYSDAPAGLSNGPT